METTDRHYHEVQRQEYQNCVISAGLVDGADPDTVYFKFERDGEEPTIFLLRPDEMLALMYCCSGALWSMSISELLVMKSCQN